MGGVEFVEEKAEGAAVPWAVGRVEFDVDAVVPVVHDAAGVQQVAGDGPVLIGVAEVGVEPIGEPVLGVVGQQLAGHLQGTLSQSGGGAFGGGVDDVRGEFGGDRANAQE